MINKDAIRKIVKAEMNNFLSPLNYKMLKPKGDIVAEFVMNDGNYQYGFHCHTNKYNEYQLIYGFSFGINKVVDILAEINSHVPLPRYPTEPTFFITGTSPGYLLDPFDPARAFKYFKTEEELLQILNDAKSFYKNDFIPFYEKCSDFVALDELINSFDDFWPDSLGKKVPLRFFHVTRLIVAQLAKNPNYDEVVERNFQALEELWKKEGFIYNRFDESKPEVFAAQYLKQSCYG